MSFGHRESIRYAGHDYLEGHYFVTLCVAERQCLFGAIVDGTMQLNEFGHIVFDEWRHSECLRQNIELDRWIVMPNHLHGVVRIDRVPVAHVGAHCMRPLNDNTRPINDNGLGREGACNAPLRRPAASLGSFIAGFKSATTRRINEWRGTPSAPVWQRGYYEHIIRTERDLQNIRQYITDNPKDWPTDEFNPKP